jgi:arylsulfatase A-like enzyme
MKKGTSFILLLFIISTGLIANLFAQSTNDKPNVIIVMTDDQGYGDLACHGNTLIKTPHLDKLHDESVRFTDFHVSPFCAPTRAALMTGRFANLTGVRATIRGRNHLDVSETTMAEYFKGSGYATGIFGKWHLGRNYPFRPMDRGFDQWVGHGDGGIGTSSDYWGNDKMNDHYMRNGKWEKFEGFSTDVFFDESMKFMAENKDKPFFAYLATNAPHWPWNVKKEWRDAYGESLKDYDKGRKRSLLDFYATITRVDDNVGRLRKFLTDEGLARNTILIFMTDNGTAGSWGVYYAGMKGIKGSAYDGGHRVPCFIHWPAKGWDKAREIGNLSAHIDILPTLVDLCGLKTPAKAKHTLSGKSLSGLLAGEKPSWPDRSLFVHCQNSERYEKWKNSAVVTAKWRLVNQNELYQIKADPEQKANVAQKHPEVVTKLQQQYEQFWEEIKGGNMPIQRAVVGSGKIDRTWLACDAWLSRKPKPLAWNQTHVNDGVNNVGSWPITIARKGTYAFELRRWPQELDCAISSTPDVQSKGDIHLSGKPVFLPQGKPIPATKAVLKIRGETHDKPVSVTDTHVRFDLELTSGDANVEAYFLDAAGNELPAYYVYVYE